MARKKKKQLPVLSSEEILEQQMARFEPLLAGDEWRRLLSELQMPLYQAVRDQSLEDRSPAGH